jgi:hypothetical protein
MANEYKPSFGDTVWGVPRPGSGIQSLYNILGGPSWEEIKDLYGTYDEGYKDPELYKDVGRFGVNTLKDIAQFFPDVLADVGQAGISQLAKTELYNPFSEEGLRRNTMIPGVDLPGWDVLMEPEWKYSLDAAQSEKFGSPTLIKDNPFKNAVYNEEGEVLTYDNPSYKKIEKKADKELDDYYFGKNGIFTEKKSDEISRLTDQAFSWEDWAAENPNTNPKKYDDEWSEEWENQFANHYDKEMTDFFQKSVDGQLLGKYNIGGGKTSPFREFEFGFDYASMGKPLLKYDPRRAKTFEKAHRVSEIAGGAGLIKTPFKIANRLVKGLKPSRKADEGIMRNAERLEDKRFDWAKRWMRDSGG